MDLFHENLNIEHVIIMGMDNGYMIIWLSDLAGCVWKSGYTSFFYRQFS